MQAGARAVVTQLTRRESHGLPSQLLALNHCPAMILPTTRQEPKSLGRPGPAVPVQTTGMVFAAKAATYRETYISRHRSASASGTWRRYSPKDYHRNRP
ncbi:hypothetical protein KPH14_012911 [Odynerus spinipes]|uniref:Uncharacterized protein n=1 Tax=Odynerus spinipes TaxID=1348599 RepID=A0AAD9VK74_9HYME|nr:hypothetical protein KPH14_012911 [Odynerus spinipes]